MGVKCVMNQTFVGETRDYSLDNLQPESYNGSFF
jgi:hypothetical protein